MSLSDDLKTLIKGSIADDDETLEKYSRDASILKIKPQAVVFPNDSQDIKSLVGYINQNRGKGLSLTPRAAGTDMTGGAINDSIIVDVSKSLNRLIEVGEGYGICEPGMLYKDFEAETLKKDLILPTYPASREICALGGMVANCAGGELNLTYGQLHKYIGSLKVVLSDGNEYNFGPLTKDDLDKKITQKDFEGKIYSNIYKLISENEEIIKEARPKVSKNSTGYHLWDVWDGEKFDLSNLFVGSQGTLGIITEINLKLVKPKKEAVLLVIRMHSFDGMDKLVNQVLEFEPEAFECYDDQTLKLATKYISELVKDFKHNNPFMVYYRFLPEILMSFSGTFPKLTLMANFTGDNRNQALQKAKDAKNKLAALNLKAEIIASPASAEKYWIIRHKSFGLLRFHSENGQASSFIDDLIVKPEYLPEFLPKLNKIIEPYKDKMVYTLAGHIGDGNFHIIPLMDLSREDVRAIIPEVMEKVFNLVFEYKGSMAAEHNDGLIRGPFLPKMYGEKVFQLFKEVKEIFDPDGIFNPHKKVDAEAKYSFEHLVREKPTPKGH